MPFWKGKLRAISWWLFPVLGLALVFMLFRWFEHSQVYRPSFRLDANPDQLSRPCEEVHLGENPRLHGWFFSADPASSQKDWAMLLCHGNGGNISHRLGYAQALLHAGVNVFLFDYRGYGQSTGRPSEEGTYADAQMAFQFLLKKGFDRKHIIVVGESLGGAVAAELTLREKPAALILHSTFTSVPDVGRRLYPWLPISLLSSIRYDTYSKLPNIHVPVLVMHSRGDGLIPFSHAEKNFARANEPKLFWELEGNHSNTIAVNADLFTKGIKKFLTLVESIPLK